MYKYPSLITLAMPLRPVHVGYHEYHVDSRTFGHQAERGDSQQQRNNSTAGGREFEADE